MFFDNDFDLLIDVANLKENARFSLLAENSKQVLFYNGRQWWKKAYFLDKL